MGGGKRNMVTSVIDDIKSTFRSGNMISKIILVNVALYIFINIVYVFSPNGQGLYTILERALSIPSDPAQLIRQPWSVFTHMFFHTGFWHVFWNMLMLYWFGQIMGDLLGDGRVLPIYLMSGLFGGLVFVLHDLFLPGGTGGAAIALGASAAVMAVVWSAAMTSPDYNMRLLLIGNVRLKYIALALLFMDLVGSAGDINKGGHWAHIGGAVFGMFYVYMLRQGTDITAPWRGLIDKAKSTSRSRQVEKTPRSKFKVVHKTNQSDNSVPPGQAFDQQGELDRILDKIKAKGYDNLNDEEKDFLYRASKKK